MQHPDEGMIHAWLDGQLPPGEAAALEAHVAECPGCAAKVAEERGFAAGATRILTALDNVPGDVIPISGRPRPMWSSPRFLQAAAMLLVVATGGLIAVRVAGNDVEIPSAATRVSAADTQVRGSVKPSADSEIAAAPTVPLTGNLPTAVAVTIPSAERATAPSVSSPAKKAAGSTLQRTVAPSVPPQSATVAQSNRSFAPATATATDAIAAAPVITTGVSAAAPPKLTVVKSEMTPEGRRTLLRTESGKVAVLTESLTSADARLESRVEAAPLRGMVGARAAVSSTRAVLESPAVRTITWKDEATGRYYTLSGEFSDAELRELRARVEADSDLLKK